MASAKSLISIRVPIVWIYFPFCYFFSFLCQSIRLKCVAERVLAFDLPDGSHHAPPQVTRLSACGLRCSFKIGATWLKSLKHVASDRIFLGDKNKYIYHIQSLWLRACYGGWFHFLVDFINQTFSRWIRAGQVVSRHLLSAIVPCCQSEARHVRSCQTLEYKQISP